MLTHPRLVHASEITVQQPTVLEHAQPVLTPTERLRRSDEVIFQALLTKQTILSQFLPGDKVRLSEFLGIKCLTQTYDLCRKDELRNLKN